MLFDVVSSFLGVCPVGMKALVWRDTRTGDGSIICRGRERKQGEWLKGRMVTNSWHHPHTDTKHKGWELHRVTWGGLHQTLVSKAEWRAVRGPVQAPWLPSQSDSLSSERFLRVMLTVRAFYWDCHGPKVPSWILKPEPTFTRCLEASSRKFTKTASPGRDNVC